MERSELEHDAAANAAKTKKNAARRRMRPPVVDLGQPISVEAAPLHDCDKRLFGRLQQADVLQGIALDNEKVGEGFRPQATELPVFAQYPRADQRCGADDLGRREDLAAQDEFAALLR